MTGLIAGCRGSPGRRGHDGTIELPSLPGDKTEIRMKLTHAPDPKGYTTSRRHVSLDLMDTKSADDEVPQPGIGNTRVTVIEAKDRTRVIVNLTQLVPYETKVENIRRSCTKPAERGAVAPWKNTATQVVKTNRTVARFAFPTSTSAGRNGEGRTS
jgi:hypothetical protein